MPRRRRRVQGRVVLLSNQQAQGFLGDLAKDLGKSLIGEVKKEVKKQLPKLAGAAVKAGRKRVRKTKLGRQLGFGLRLAGQRGRGPRGKQVRRRRRKPGVRIIMV